MTFCAPVEMTLPSAKGPEAVEGAGSLKRSEKPPRPPRPRPRGPRELEPRPREEEVGSTEEEGTTSAYLDSRACRSLGACQLYCTAPGVPEAGEYER